MKRRFILGGFLLLLISCNTSQKMTGTSKTAKVPTCSNAANERLRLEWFSIFNPIQSDIANYTLPSEFKTYTIPADQLKTFFTGAKKADKSVISIPLPAPANCQEFEVHNSSAMQAGLAAKYPDLVSLQGTGTTDHSADVRLDYDGSKMNGQILMNGKVIMIVPVDYNGSTAYIIYDKSNSNIPKEPFETTPTGKQPTRNRITEPVPGAKY